MAFLLFLVFKSSFVRHDNHATIAGCFIVIAALSTAILFFDLWQLIGLVLAVTTWTFIADVHSDVGPDTMFARLETVYSGPWKLLFSGGKAWDAAQVSYNQALMTIRRKVPVPRLDGTVDIYPTDQSAVLTSGNRWDPRPVFQSYSAFTPELEDLNEQHLRGNAAPDNVLFSVDPIDDHLPALEDGLSWPALLDNYTPAGLHSQLVYLRRNQLILGSSNYTLVSEARHANGAAVAIPATSGPLFATVDLQPTLLGKFVGAIYKFPKVDITVTLTDKTARTYRVIPSMMRSGFILSPLVKSTNDCAALLTGDAGYFQKNRVASISIDPVFGSGTLWNPGYDLKLMTYQR